VAEDESPPLPRRPSISDVAAAAGVSRAAVSKVIRHAYGVSPDMRTRVSRAIDELGYRPRVAARAMRGASLTIGFEIPHLGNDVFTQFMTGAGQRLAGSDYQLIIAPRLAHVSGTSVLESLADRQVDGIIAVAPEVEGGWLERLAAQVPMVLLARHDRPRNYDVVTVDDAVGADLVMDHLLALGHRRIAHLTIPSDIPRKPHAPRLATYRRRMNEVGAVPWVVFTDSEQGAYDAARDLLQADRPPTAIFAGHDVLALEVLRALADLGLDEHDVSVVGFDDVDLARHPRISLTTVHAPSVEMGALAVDLLLERIRGGRRSPKEHQFTPELRVRRSSHPVGPGRGVLDEQPAADPTGRPTGQAAAAAPVRS
jgi:LacI family transcriptional regulator